MGSSAQNLVMGAQPIASAPAGHTGRQAPFAIGVTRLQPARLTRSGVDLNNHLMRNVPLSSLQWHARTQQWRWVCAKVSSDSTVELVLADGECRCVLAIHSESTAGIDSSIELDAFEGEPLVLAATLRYAGIIAHLAALSLRPWRCCGKQSGR